MLASITPLGERGRHSHWTITLTAFLVGCVTAGAAAGGVLGAAGALVLSAAGDELRLFVLAVALSVAILLDLRPGGLPGPRRQVNERWLDQYRGWVYGVGYGAQLGVGVSTVVASAATYVALLAALLSGGPAGGALIVGCYAAVRGLTPLLAANVHTTEQLLALHARLAAVRAGAARAGTALMGAAAIAALTGGMA